ncbi:Hypothetical predicted protein [Octopus vulgaris]|uniref:Uncharacterized protein n=1 Tax=Octopus vulgaris TaxID=6645 RepID=A0AA36F0Y3_OCTVU|nr:Hypothetical predicted protein [Octopus vulgaris]
MPTSTRATPVSSSTSEAEIESKYLEESEKLDEEPTQTRRKYSKTGTATKSTMKEAVKLKNKMKKSLNLEKWSLHFDGKRIDDQECQVLILKNEQGEVKLEALQLPKGKADTVVKGITADLGEYNLWNCVKMIVADTTSVKWHCHSVANIVCSKGYERTAIYWLSASYP